MNKSTMAPKPKRTGPYKYFVPMSIGEVICKAMVDSGNLWKNVLSLDFLHQLGLTRNDLLEVPGIQEVGTAKSGNVLGELKTPIHLRFGGCATRFKCRPVVLEGLSMPFNLSGPFLAQFGIDQLHSEGALLVQGKKIPMVALLNPSTDVEQTVSNLYVMEKVTVPAFSETKFAVRTSAVEEGAMSPGDGIVTGSVQFLDRHDLHPFLNVVTKCDKDGQVRVGMMNTTMDRIVIPVGNKCMAALAGLYTPPTTPNILFASQLSTISPKKRLSERRQLPRRRPPKRLSQLIRLSQSWHPGWLGPQQQQTKRPGSPT
jgi:hypothetical protein